VTLTNGVTNLVVVNFNPWVPAPKIFININVVPASGVEPERLAAGDFKSLTYPNEVNGLTS
jgi:hypothetical protein